MNSCTASLPTRGVQELNFVNGIVDSLPPGLLEGRPAGNSFFLTSHQLQQLQQQLQAAAVVTANQQHQQTEQVATASGGLTLALHHSTGGGAGVLTPQLLLAPQTTPSFAAYPVTSGAQHTTSIQQVLQHHVRQSSILQSTIQQVGTQHTQQQSFTETSNGIINGSSTKCIPVSPASPFSSRSLTPSPQQRVLTPQPVFQQVQQVMNAAVPVLQFYQPARTATVAAAAIAPQPKNKPPQQILPKPITNIMTQTTTIKPQPAQANAQTGALLLNQMIPNAGVIVGQQTSSGVQFILKSPSPQSISTSVPKAQVVVSSNGSITTSPNTVFVQANRTQPQQQQLVRLITGQSLQLQQIQTSSGPAFVAVSSVQPTTATATLQPTNSTAPPQNATVVPSVTTVPVQTSIFNQNVIKKTTNSNSANVRYLAGNNCAAVGTVVNAPTTTNSCTNHKKKKKKEEETTKLDLANLIKISGIDEEDIAVTSTTSTMSLPSPTAAACHIQTASPQNRVHVESQSHHQTHVQQELTTFATQTIPQRTQTFAPSQSPPKQNTAATLLSQLQTNAAPQCGLRLSIGDDGHVMLHQPQMASQSVTASVAAAAQTQLAQLVAEHGSNILQNAVFSLTGSESFFTLRQPQIVLRRCTTTTPSIVLAAEPSGAATMTALNGVSGINGLSGKVQFVSSNAVQDHNRVIVAGVANPATMSLTEQQQRVQIVTAAGVPDLGGMSLTTTEQQNHLQILTSSVPNTAATEVSLTEKQQNRVEIISNVPKNAAATTTTRTTVNVIPELGKVSVTEHLVSDMVQQQILTNVPTSVGGAGAGANIHEQRMIFQNEQRNISSSERTDVHITDTISNQQSKLQMIANLPMLNESDRFQLIQSGDGFAVAEEKAGGGDKLERLKLEATDGADQRYHVISNLEENKRFVQVNDEPNRIIVEHQTVLNTSTMSFNDTQSNGVQTMAMTGGGGGGGGGGLATNVNVDPQHLLQQLEEQQHKIQIIANLPQQQCVMRLNEQQNKVTLKNIESLMQPQLHTVVTAATPPTSVAAAQLSKVCVRLKDVTKFVDSDCFHDKLPESNGDAADRAKMTNVWDDPEANKSRCAFDSTSSSTATANVAAKLSSNAVLPAFKSTQKSNACAATSSVINPHCAPSPQSPPFGCRNNHSSPTVATSVAAAVIASNCVLNSCFTSRPNVTVVAQQPSPSTMNQNYEHSLPAAVVNKPCAAVISTGGVNMPLLTHIPIEQTKNGYVLEDGFSSSATMTTTTTTTMTTTLQQQQQMSPLQSADGLQSNSFLDSMQLSHPSLLVGKTGIVQPCSKPSNVIRGKKPKKSAVVKPMIFQPEDKEKSSDGPACLNPVPNDGVHSNAVQRVQTIQLTPQKQQSLKLVQSQIATLSGKKTRTPNEQATLQRLFNEQQKILLSGKIIPTVPGQNTQGLTFVSTPVRLVPPPSTPPSPHPPSTPPTCNKATSPLHVQVGTQTTLDEQVPVAAPSLDSLTPSSEPTASQTIVQLSPVPAPNSPPLPALPVLTPAKRAALINEQLEIDQRSVTNPDTSTAFSSISDAYKRLLRYHCFDEPVLSEKDLEKADEIFEATAKHLLDKNAQMLNKYSYLLCKESMREFQTCELIMLGRLFVADEQQSLEQMKLESNANNTPTTCSTATQVDAASPSLPSLVDELTSAVDSCPVVNLDELMEKITPSLTDSHQQQQQQQRSKREYDDDAADDIFTDTQHEAKKHCPDDEEINAQVQSAIDSILNLQRSDPATDEAVRSILPS